MAFECTRFQCVDDATRGLHWYLDKDDECYFIGEYTKGQGYGYSKINQAIYNLKIEPKIRLEKPGRYRYKTDTIAAIGDCFRQGLRVEDLQQRVTVIPIPPSKTKMHPDYDDRISQVCNRMVVGISTPDVKDIIVSNADIDATHNQEHKPPPDELIKLYSIQCPDDYQARELIFLVDDMLTTGSHFKACKHLLLERFPDRRVIGIFFTRRVEVNPFEEFDVIDTE